MSDIYYGSNQAATTVTTGNKFALNATGGADTQGSNNIPGSASTGHMQLGARGGTQTVNASVPTTMSDANFQGWMLDTTGLEGKTIPSGTWTFNVGVADTGGADSGVTLTVQFWKRTSGAVWTQIGSNVALTGQSVGATRTNFTFTSGTLNPAFVTGDKLCVVLYYGGISFSPVPSAFTMVVWVSNSATAGVNNDAMLTTPTASVPGTLTNKETTWRGKLSKQIGKETTWRGKVLKSVGKETTWRLPIAHSTAREMTWRGKLVAHGPASGGFCLYANGTGVASFDDFRVTAYPDPSLALEPVGRLGSSFVSWNAALPSTATTLSMYTSIRGDGSDWVDVTSQSGGPIPGLYGQPDPTIDGFSVDSSMNYNATNRTGGAAPTVTYDTAYSRVVLTGGTNGLYLYSSLARADIDELCVMDRADAGGLVWRFVDQSNYYVLVIADNLASVGTPNRATLYSVVAGVQTQLAQASITFVRGTFHSVRVSMLGGVITATLDGASLFSYTDPSPLGAGLVGLFNNGGITGSRYYQLWIQPQGDSLLNTYVYTKEVEASTDATLTPQLLDMTVGAFNPNIGPGALIPGVDNRKKFGDKVLDDAAQQSGDYSWFIDQNLQFHFNKRTVTPAPWVLYSAPFGLVGGVDLEADNQLKVTVANDLYRNRQTLLGVINSGTFSNTFVGNGQNTSFTLSYPLAPGFIPTIKLNGNLQSVALKGKTGAQWYYAPGDPVIAQDTGGTVLTSSDTLSVPLYTGTFLDTVTVDNVAAQQALKAVEVDGTGIVEAVEDVSGRNMTYAAGLVYAGQKLARYCIKDARTMTFTTLRNGLAVGQILSVFVVEENLWDAQMLILGMDITMQTQPNDTILYTYLVTVSELAPMASWSKLLAAGILLS